MPPNAHSLRRCHATLASLRPAPVREPLLFLYPRWFASASVVPETTLSRQQDVTRDESYEPEPAADITRADIRFNVAPTQAPKDVQTPAHSPRGSTSGATTRRSIRRIERGEAPRQVQLVRSVKSDVFKHKTEYAQKKTTRALELQLTRHGTKHWEDTLKLLEQHVFATKWQDVKKAERLYMPPGTHNSYSGNWGELFLEIMLLTDCHVQLLNAEEGVLTLVGTSDSVRLAKARLALALKVAPEDGTDAASTGQDQLGQKDLASSAARPAIRAVWSRSSVRRRAMKYAAAVCAPPKWTVVSFANVVDELVGSEMPIAAQKKLYQVKGAVNENKHLHRVTVTLLQMFTEPYMLPYISSYACATAFTHLAYHREYPAIRRIFQHLDRSNFEFRPKVFESLVLAAAKEQDLANFNFGLRLMLDRNVTPTVAVWSALVRLVSRTSALDGRRIVSAMRENGLLINKAAQMAACEPLVKDDYQAWIEKGGTTASFFTHYDALWSGKAWLSDSSAHHMLAVGGRQSAPLSNAELILDELERRGHQPNIVSLNTLLRYVTTSETLEQIFELGERFLRRHATIEPDATTFSLLFAAARAGQCYNLWRVVWRYACMHGLVKSNMTTIMRRGILAPVTSSSQDDMDGIEDDDEQASSAKKGSRRRLFRNLAAKAAVGIAASVQRPILNARNVSKELSSPQPSFDDQLIRLCEPQPLPVSPESDSSPSESPQTNRVEELLQLVQADMDCIGSFRPIKPLFPMLIEAYALDKTWKQQGLQQKLRRSNDLGWLLQHAIEVPVVAGSVPGLEAFRRKQGTRMAV